MVLSFLDANHACDLMHARQLPIFVMMLVATKAWVDKRVHGCLVFPTLHILPILQLVWGFAAV